MKFFHNYSYNTDQGKFTCYLNIFIMLCFSENPIIPEDVSLMSWDEDINIVEFCQR